MKTNPSSLCHTRRKGIFLFLILFGLLGTAGGTAAEVAPYYRDLFPDTWVGHDTLGRNVPTYSVVGPANLDISQTD